MAKLIEVVSSMTVKVNVGDYQSVDFFTSGKVETGATSLEDASAALHRQLERATLAKLRSHFKARGKKMTDEQICRVYGLRILQPPKPEFG